MKFNNQQQTFFDRVTNLDFTKIFLMGEAGTGKTFLLCEIAKFFAANDFRVCFASPTHQAKQVIREKLGIFAQGHGIYLKTIASLLGRALLRGSTGEMFALSPGIKAMAKFDIIICDEMSMVGESEVATFLHEGLIDKPMIFTGDPEQLPPVKQKAGRIWEKIEVFNLTEQMRQSGEVYELAKRNIQGVDIPRESSDDITVLYNNDALTESFVETIKHAENPLDHLYVAYTNAEVDKVASLVHKSLYGSEPFNVGQYIKLDRSTPIAAKGTEVEIIALAQPLEPHSSGLNYYDVCIEYGNDKHWIKLLSPEEQKRWEYKVKYCLECLKKLLDNNENDCNREMITVTRRELDDLEDTFTPIISPYAMTVHKAQGITKKNVWVATDKLNKAAFKRNLVYVAISRCSGKLYINAPQQKIKCVSYYKMLTQLKKEIGRNAYEKIWAQLREDPNFSTRGPNADFYRQRFIQAILEVH